MLKKFQFTKKKDKLDNAIKDKSNSQKLDIVISEIKKIKEDISEFREEFKKYKKQDSDFQEAHINNFIVSLLDHNRSTYITKLLSIKNIYVPNSKNPLSELDGVILYTPNQSKMPSISKELLNRADTTFHKSLKENLTEINTVFTKPYLILVESKRSLNKQKIDMKLKQIYEFMNILSRLDKIDLTTTMDDFKKLIETLQKESQLTINDLSTIDILFIVGSDDISSNLKNYILQIEKGINEEEYDNISGILFKKDTYVQPHIKKIIESKDTPKLVKSKLKSAKNTLENVKSITKSDLSEFDMEYITDYLTPYEDLEHIFKAFKGKLGVTQFNRIEFPQLLQFTAVNKI
jgi:hypothetical protein